MLKKLLISIWTEKKRTDVFLDCSNMERPDWMGKQLINLNTVEYLNKDNIIFGNDEIMQLHFIWENLEDIEDLGLLIEVCSLDDVAHGTFELYDFYSGKAGANVDMVLNCDISGFVPAEYKLRFTFFYKNEYGVGNTVDWVQGLCFEKEKYDRGNKLLWIPKSWGYHLLPAPIVQCIEDKCYDK